MSFCYFDFFFWQSMKFVQQNINHSEIGIDDKELLVELNREERWRYIYRKTGIR